MTSFKSFYRRNVVWRTTQIFAVILVILNIGVWQVNKYYMNENRIHKEEAFAEIVEHILRENSERIAIEYIEHYGHIHNTAIRLYSPVKFVYSSQKVGDDYNRYDIGHSGYYVYIDSSESPNSVISSSLATISNIVYIIVYAMTMIVYYTYTNSKTNIIVDDLTKMYYSIRDHQLAEQNFIFQENQVIFNEFVSLYQRLEDAKLLKANKLQSITHDLKTSLTVVRTYLDGAMNGRIELDEVAFNDLIEEIKFTNALVESLKDDYNSEIHMVDLSKIIDEVVATFHTMYKTKNIALQVINPEEVVIRGDKVIFVRILQNLLSNSFYYSDANTMVTISLEKGDSIKLRVKDEGIGIPKEQIEHIFKKNYRIKASNRRNKKGTGMGLYIVKLLVEDLGGSITVDGENGTDILIELYS